MTIIVIIIIIRPHRMHRTDADYSHVRIDVRGLFACVLTVSPEKTDELI